MTISIALQTLAQTLKRRTDLRVIGIDPGETTGACVLDGCNLVHHAQLNTSDMEIAPQTMFKFLSEWCLHLTHPPIIVVEDYRIYGWKSDDHKWASLHTSQFIGCIKTICALYSLPFPLMQMAQVAKGFCTDEKLKTWGMYVVGEKHSRDAIRHAIWCMLFNKEIPNGPQQESP